MHVRVNLAVGLLAVLLVSGCAAGPTDEPAPDSAAGLLRQAHQAYQQAQPQRCLELARRVAELEPRSARAHLLQGMALRLEAAGQTGEQAAGSERAAIEAFARAVELDPGNLAARVNLASSLLHAGQAERAGEHLRAAASRSPDEPWARALVELSAGPQPSPRPSGAPAPERPAADEQER